MSFPVPLPHLLFVASALLLAVGAVLTKLLLSPDMNLGRTIHPLPLLTLQLLGGVTMLVVVNRWRGAGPTPVLASVSTGIILGLGSIGTIMALAFTSASEAAVVFAMQPVVILGLAWLLLGERFGITVAALAMLSVLGVVMIVVSGNVAMSANRPLGLAFAALSTAIAALYTVRMRQLGNRGDMITALLVVQMTACAIVATIWAMAVAMGIAVPGLGSVSMALSAFAIGMVYYGAAFLIYMIGLRRTEASQAGIYLSLVPVFTIGLAAAILSERLTASQLIGSALVVASVAGITYRSRSD